MAGVYLAPWQGMTDLLETAATSGFVVCRVNLSQAADKHALLGSLASALAFPDWFGQNWDALADCLCDLSWLTAQGYLLQLEGVEEFRVRNGRDLDIALGILSSAADFWRKEGVPFWVLTDSGVEGIPPLPWPI